MFQSGEFWMRTPDLITVQFTSFSPTLLLTSEFKKIFWGF
jgi:hypothetical protein